MAVRICALIVMMLPVFPVGAQDDDCSERDREAYLHDVVQAVSAAWKVPYTNRTLSCSLLIKQNFRGEVLNVGIARCGDDPNVHKSVIDAGYEASPLPLPGKKACFSRDIIISLSSRTQDAG